MSTVTIPQTTTAGWPAGTGVEYYDPNAERVSKMIDEGLKQEAIRRREAKKREVRGAYGFKPRIRFQLFYASHTLERERPSWRPAVYLNIIRAARTLLDGLEHEVTLSIDNPPDPDFPITKGIVDEITRMATALQPLLEAETPLALELNGGLTGRASVYARFGWQALIDPRRSSSDTLTDLTPGALRVAEMLKIHNQALDTLWRYPLVISLLARRKLRIEESAP
ncbi:hypothetical protein H0H87_000994 [Tephrocybe sp. NHM501043]|nr:hypothetical protein H0H87_000994 [Tephrocybe sp. NHM501043]